jgi:Kef-type K+ transport system membrane component KefB/nucleotide-binding universal stress UspA family protein
LELANHSDIQTFLLQVAALLFLARILGQLCIRIGQPAVIGEILAGLVLGPSCFGLFFPELSSHFLPTTSAQFNLLEGVSLIGVLFLLFVTGLEIDIGLIYRQIRVAIGVALGGLILPLTAGFTFGYLLPAEYLISPERRELTACFFAISMGISAIPVVARVLIELNLTRRNVAQTLFAAAMIDDAIGWILLSSVIGLASTGVFNPGTVASSLFSVLGLVIVSLTIGRFIVSKFLDFLFNNGLSSSMLSYTISLLFLWGWFSQMLHLEAIFGAFILGIIFSLTPKLQGDVLHTIETITNQFFAPLFFALAGLKISLSGLGETRFLLLAMLFIVVSILSKFIGVYIGARTLGKEKHWPSIFFASGLNARGSMGVIIASIGLSLNVLTPELYAILVLMSVITSIMAPPALRYSVQRIELNEEESSRLRKEEIESVSFLSSIKRVLFPIRPRSLEMQNKFRLNEIDIYQKLREKVPIDATLLSVYNNETELKSTQEFVDQIAKTLPDTPKKQILDGSKQSVGDYILDEVKKGYDLMVLGVTNNKASGSNSVFNPMVDYTIRMSNCPVILIQGRLPDFENIHGTRILVPTGGSISAKKAAELSFVFLNNPNSELHLLKVIEEESERTNHIIKRRQLFFGRQVLNELKEFSSAHGIKTTTQLQVGPDPETVILETIIRKEIDLLILGTRIRPVGERLYLGPRIERLVNEATCTVIILNT